MEVGNIQYIYIQKEEKRKKEKESHSAHSLTHTLIQGERKGTDTRFPKNKSIKPM
jgi:hypothetical protein